jgi:hypothetical protein
MALKCNPEIFPWVPVDPSIDPNFASVPVSVFLAARFSNGDQHPAHAGVHPTSSKRLSGGQAGYIVS